MFCIFPKKESPSDKTERGSSQNKTLTITIHHKSGMSLLFHQTPCMTFSYQ